MHGDVGASMMSMLANSTVFSGHSMRYSSKVPSKVSTSNVFDFRARLSAGPRRRSEPFFRCEPTNAPASSALKNMSQVTSLNWGYKRPPPATILLEDSMSVQLPWKIASKISK